MLERVKINDKTEYFQASRVSYGEHVWQINSLHFPLSLFSERLWVGDAKMLGTDLVWARDPHEGYIQGRITELGAHEYEVLPVDRAHQRRTCSIDDIFPSCEAKSDHDDNCEFPWF